MYRSIKNISIILIAAQGICLQSFGDAVDLAAMKDNIDHLEKDCGVPPAKIASAMADIQRADLASPMCEMAKTRGVSAVGEAGQQQMVDAGGCGASADSKKAAAYAQLKAAASGAKVPAPLKDNSNQAQINRCKAAKDAISNTADKVATASGMNAMQMMQMGQMGMQMLGQLASLAGSGSGSGSSGSGSAVTSAGPTAQSVGDSGVSAPASPSTPSTPSATADSTGGTAAPAGSFALGSAGSADPAGTPPDSSITAANGGAPPGGAGGAGALGANLGSGSSSGTGIGTGTAVNSYAAMNAFNQDDGSAPAGGAMLGLKGSNDFQGLDPAGKDPMGGAGALGGGAAGFDPNGEAGRGIASGDGQALAQNDVNDPSTSLFDLVSVKMREMKKRGSL